MRAAPDDDGPADPPSGLEVVLVDGEDREVGRAPKVAAHRPPGLRHRAFSLFVHDGAGALLLQRRAFEKYHFGGRWTNTCCSHPAPGELVADAARRRLREEMGIGVGPLRAAGRFEYRAVDAASGLVEHELDHVVVGPAAASAPRPAPQEVAAWRWVDLPALLDELRAAPATFTPWFAPALALAAPWIDEDVADRLHLPGRRRRGRVVRA